MPPYAPKFLEPGSELILTPTLTDDDSRLVMATENTQLVSAMGSPKGEIVKGSKELVKANFKSLSRAFSEIGVPVKAWSFFSGKLPGAEMMYVGEDGPEDILTVTEARGVAEVLEDKRMKLRSLGITRESNGVDDSYAELEDVLNAGLLDICIIDDWAALLKELNSRVPEVRALGNPYTSPNLYPLRGGALGTLFFIAGKTPPFTLLSDFKLESFSGYRAYSVYDRELFYAQPRKAGSFIGRRNVIGALHPEFRR